LEVRYGDFLLSGAVRPSYDLQVVPSQVDPVNAVTPRCTQSRETVTVPSEDGGTRQITITRC
jgi:hypothetical protein